MLEVAPKRDFLIDRVADRRREQRSRDGLRRDPLDPREELVDDGSRLGEA
jgi:hypothetical protein